VYCISSSADSRYIVISGQHTSKALEMLASEWRAKHITVPDTILKVNATVLVRGMPKFHHCYVVLLPAAAGSLMECWLFE
jgi:hypothetical protein